MSRDHVVTLLDQSEQQRRTVGAPGHGNQDAITCGDQPGLAKPVQ
jgi:hypothetical protein